MSGQQNLKRPSKQAASGNTNFSFFIEDLGECSFELRYCASRATRKPMSFQL